MLDRLASAKKLTKHGRTLLDRPKIPRLLRAFGDKFLRHRERRARPLRIAISQEGKTAPADAPIRRRAFRDRRQRSLPIRAQKRVSLLLRCALRITHFSSKALPGIYTPVESLTRQAGGLNPFDLKPCQFPLNPALKLPAGVRP